MVRSLRSGHVTSRVFEDERVAAVPPLAGAGVEVVLREELDDGIKE